MAPPSQNGNGEDELAARRAQDGSDPLAEGDAASVEARAAEGEHEEDDDGQLGFVVGDEPARLSKLIKSGMPIEVEVSLMSAAVPSDGLLDPNKAGVLLVEYEPRKYECVPVREHGRVTRWKLRQQVRPTDIRSANEEALKQRLDSVTEAAAATA